MGKKGRGRKEGGRMEGGGREEERGEGGERGAKAGKLLNTPMPVLES